MKKLIVLVVSAMALTACGPGASDLPLPGSSMPGDTYTITADFDDALNLSDGGNVKLNGVQIGRVTDVEVVTNEQGEFRAIVTMDISRDVPLYDDTTAVLRSTTPLGELFVALTSHGVGSPLSDGHALGRQETFVAPTIEDTMATASLLINGAGLGHINTIVNEANNILGGREETIQRSLNSLERTLRTLNNSSDDISIALNALSSVSQELNNRQGTIEAALRDIPPAAAVLSSQVQAIVALVDSAGQLSGDVTSFVGTTRADILRVLEEVGPVLEEISSVRPVFGAGLQELITVGQLLDNAVPTEYLNFFLTIDGLLDELAIGGSSGPAPFQAPTIAQSRQSAPASGPSQNLVPDLVGLILGDDQDLIENLVGGLVRGLGSQR